MEGLPRHFHREAQALQLAGITSWTDLAAVPDELLEALPRRSLASGARLQRLRAQARLMGSLELPAEAASLLLHGGIPDRASLAAADPDDLLRRLQRLERSLLQGRSRLTITDLHRWIQAARRDPGRSGN